jgi:hypothetical protein
LSCSLTHVALSKAPPFVALSYCWGDLHYQIPITVNRVEVSITVNLYTALKRLRLERIEFVWVDSLCINQDDSEERSIQITKMRTIFSQAEKVAVWLGDEQGIEEDDMTSLSAKGAEIALSVSAQQALLQLLSRPYWTRIWIIQELAVASSIIILCGRHKLSWEAFSHYSNTEFVAAADETANNRLERFEKILEFRIDNLTPKPIRLLDALYRSQSALSTDPKDKLYALLGLVFDGGHFIPEPNYSLSKEETYTNFSLALIKKKFPLDFIYLRTSNRQVHDSLPSWVVDWSDLNDPLAREEFGHISILPAFSTPHLNKQDQVSALKNTLVIRGLILGSIDGLSTAFFAGRGDPAAHVVLSPETRAISMQPDFDYSSYIFNALLETWRPSTAGITPPPSLIGLWSSTRKKLGELFHGHTSAVELEKQERLSDWFDENRSLPAFGRTMGYWDSTWTSQRSDEDWSPSETTCLRSLIRTIMSGMRIAIFETGELGWVHPQSHKGDKITKILGCDRYVVLRPYSTGYRVIGEARPYWLVEPELSDKTESLTIF